MILWNGFSHVSAASVSSLRLLELKVPDAAELGESTTLECKFELGGGEDSLYSVKWYKDDHEFFRYTPDDQPQIQLFPVAGVTLDVSSVSHPWLMSFVCILGIWVTDSCTCDCERRGNTCLLVAHEWLEMNGTYRKVRI
ncbi:hypothetical protein J437_LFUL000795 [Ladona fulva]|uniref:Ig-like domain-containing protein n=1 Tax=Ladona fulva TaxID=123851 RepID=A0A8K0P8S8_LADFU|nr:hypothetical protein J437_LFUL000795 [Ladona fulva]